MHMAEPLRFKLMIADPKYQGRISQNLTAEKEDVATGLIKMEVNTM